jgi:hypothetical protein
MFGVHFLQSTPTTYVMRYKNGQLVDCGLGLTLLYFGPGSTIVRINQASQDIPFVFEQQTLDFQDVTIQGNLTYRVIAPERLAGQLDFSVDARGHYLTDDPSNLQERLVRLLQSQTHTFTRDQSLGEMLSASNLLAEHLMNEPGVLSAASGLGLEIESIVILSIRADPEMATAMQAEARERLLQSADEAIHQRRKMAIELEREIREKELGTERVVQEKKREVRQAELEADVAIEQGRAELVTQQAENESKLAQVRIETLRATLEAMGEVDWRTLVASAGRTDSKQLIAMAFGELAENASKIGRLDITPDLLRQLMDDSSQGDK